MATGSFLLNSLSEETWYILPSVLKTYEKVFNDKFISKTHFEAIAELDNIADNPLVQKIGSKAIINMGGTLVRKAGFLDAMCGINGMDVLSQAFVSAMQDTDVDHVILNWDSPGGSAMGTPEFANLVYSLRGTKRITSFVSGSMCSAAYFIGAAADEIYASSQINQIGSIGVVTMHIDQSQMDKEEGIKYTYIYAGKHKIDGNPHEPLAPEALSRIQESLNYAYGIFLDSVSQFRGADKEEISKYAEGQVFNAGQLMGTPMIDGIATFDEILRS